MTVAFSTNAYFGVALFRVGSLLTLPAACSKKKGALFPDAGVSFIEVVFFTKRPLVARAKKVFRDERLDGGRARMRGGP